MPPEQDHPITEHGQIVDISRYRVVVEVALHDRAEPFARLWDRIMHALRSCCLISCNLARIRLLIVLRFSAKLPLPVFPADMRESQKIERFGLSFSSLFPVVLGKPPELNPARLVWV